jgi:hypothetical protein
MGISFFTLIIESKQIGSGVMTGILASIIHHINPALKGPQGKPRFATQVIVLISPP